LLLNGIEQFDGEVRAGVVVVEIDSEGIVHGAPVDSWEHAPGRSPASKAEAMPHGWR